jgi:glutaredoxin
LNKNNEQLRNSKSEHEHQNKSLKMKILILATKNCNHRPQLETRLKKMNIPYNLKYVEEHPELATRFKIHSSPNIIVDGEVVFRGEGEQSLPSKQELKMLFAVKLFDQGKKIYNPKTALSSDT